MSRARDKANSTVSNFASTGIDDNADANAITIDSSENVGIGTNLPDHNLTLSANSNPIFEMVQVAGGPYKHQIAVGGNDLQLRASSGALIMYTGNADGASSTERLRIDSSGNVTMANQPSVSARATATNLAVGSQTTLTLDNERYDVGSNLASNTFTAPVTGKYLFTYTLYFVDVDTANTALGVQVITSNTQYENWISPDHIANSDFFYTATSAQIADMDVNDTLQFKVYVSAGAAQTDVHPDSKISIALLS